MAGNKTDWSQFKRDEEYYRSQQYRLNPNTDWSQFKRDEEYYQSLDKPTKRSFGDVMRSSLMTTLPVASLANSQTARDFTRLVGGGAIKGAGNAVEGVERSIANAFREPRPTRVRFMSEDGQLTNPRDHLPESEREAADERANERMREWHERNPAYQPSRFSQWMKGTGEGIQKGVSPDMAQAMEDSQIDGDILSPSTWTLGKNPSVRGLAGHIAQVGGEMLPIVAAGAVPGVGPGLATLTATGQASAGAYEEARDYVMKADAAEIGRSREYQNLIGIGLSDKEAREVLADKAGSAAMGPAGAIGGLSGMILSGAATAPVQRAITNRMGNTFSARMLGNAAEMPMEGAQEVAESVAGRFAANRAADLDRDLTEGTFADAVLGAAAAGPVAVAQSISPGKQEGQPGLRAAMDEARRRLVEGDRARNDTAIAPQPLREGDDILGGQNTMESLAQAIHGRGPDGPGAAPVFDEAGIDSMLDGLFAQPDSGWRADLESVQLPEPVAADLSARYEAAEQIMPAFESGLGEIAESVGGRAIVAPLKGVDRAASKVMGDYEGNASLITDLVRGTIEIPDVSSAADILSQLRERYGEPIKEKNTLDPSQPAPFANGYRDINSTWMIDGQPVEVQVNVPEMLVAKKQAHPLYVERAELMRSIEAEGRDPTADELSEIARLDAEQAAIYQPAWEAAMRRMNSSSEMKSASASNRVLDARTGSPDAQLNVRAGLYDQGSPSTNPNFESGGSASEASFMSDTSGESVSQQADEQHAMFPPESGTLGIPRTQMPQIKGEHRQGFLRFLSERGIESQAGQIDAAELKPTQADYSPEAVDRFARTGPIGQRSVLVSSDGYVLDGHHQWMAMRSLGQPVDVIQLDAPIRELLSAADAFPHTQRSDKVVPPEAPGDSQVTMQNRDRSRAASVAQMQGIRRNPEPDRLGFSRDPNAGAPMVSEGAAIAEADKGASDVVVMASGRRVPVRYAVVEADALAASHDADGHANPDYDAAPLKALNNGRVAGLQAAWQAGNADAYRDGIMADARLHGVSPEAIASKRNPVLVRLYDPAENTGDMGAESNASTQLGLSPVEQAQTDARALPDMGGIQWAEDGTLNPAQNAGFFRAFFKNIGAAQAATLQDAQGRPNAQALQRVRAAMVERAYGDPRLLMALVEDANPDNRNIVNALVRAAAGFAQLDQNHPLTHDLRALLTDALETVRDAARRGMSVADAVAQGDLLGRDANADAVAVFMSESARSPRRMAEAFTAMAEYTDAAQRQGSVADIFGNAPEPSVEYAIAQANQALREAYGPDIKTIPARAPAPVESGRGESQRDGQRGSAAESSSDPGSGFALAGQSAGADPAGAVSESQGGLFGAPTSADYLDAHRRARDDARNGRTGTGRTDMMAGAGDLFAGPRPEQMDIEGQQETGSFGPIFRQFRHDAQGAIAHLLEKKTGEAVAALHHPDVGDIDLVWGKEGDPAKDHKGGYGLAKIAKKHPEVLNDLQGFIGSMQVKSKDSTWITLESVDGKGVVRLDWDGDAKKWLVSAYEKRPGSRTTSDTAAVDGAGDTARRATGAGGDSTTASNRHGTGARSSNAAQSEPKRSSRNDSARQYESGIPVGLPSMPTAASERLARALYSHLRRNGYQGEPPRFEQVVASELPHELHAGLQALGRSTGTRVVIFRNLTPWIDDFNGVNFGDGTVYINETSENPATLTATHEWVHNLKNTDPDLYQVLENEVRRQGRIPEWHQRNIKEEGQDRGRDHAIEELTAAAVSDALTDPDFLRRMANRSRGTFRRVARAFLDFLNTLTSKWRDQGSNVYLRDVEAFRDRLAEVLDAFENRNDSLPNRGSVDAMFQRVFHGTPQIEPMYSRRDGPTPEARAEAERQFKATERAYGGRAAYDKAKADGRTRLTYGQWVQVRTPNFKRWFGDWEAVRAQQRLDDMEPIKVRVPSAWRGLPMPDLRARVEAALLDIMASGEPLHHPEIGDVSLVRKGIKKALSASADPAKLMTLGDLRRAFEGSFFASASPAEGDGPNVVAYEKLLARLSIDGTDVVAVFSVQKMTDGRKFYNSVTLDDGQNKTPVASPRDTPIAGEHAASANTGVSEFIRRPLARVNPADVSKVVDPTTGEPMVVYHGTNRDFSKFNRAAEGRFIPLPGMFFSPDPAIASRFSETSDVELSDERRAAQITGSNVMPVFLSVPRLHEIDASRETHGRMPSDSVIRKAMQWAEKQGADGVAIKDWADGSGPLQYAVFDPTVIKSATGNLGTFDDSFGEVMFSRKAETKAAYEARIDELFAGAKGNRQGIRILDRADMLDLLGHGDKPLHLVESAVRKRDAEGRIKHPGMTLGKWKRLPEWIENPVAVFESDTVPGRMTMVAPEIVGGKPALVVIEPNGDMAGLKVHVAVNAYEKDNAAAVPVSRWVRDGKLLYLDQKVSPAFSERSGLQLPGEVRQLRGYKRKVLTDADLVKYRADRGAEQEKASKLNERSGLQLPRDVRRNAGSGGQFPGSGAELRGFNKSLKTERDLVKNGTARETLNDAVMERNAWTLDEARAQARVFVGQPLTNESTGLEARVSNTNLAKMTSEKAGKKSSSGADHALAVANVDKLFRNALLNNSHSDSKGEPTIAAIHRYVAPMVTHDGRVVAVKMTVKETTGPREPNPVYSIETLDIQNPPSVLSRANPDGTGIHPQAGFSANVLKRIEAVKRAVADNIQRGPMFSRKSQTREAYEQRIDELFAGAKPNREGVRLLDEGDVLTIAGYGNMPVVMNENHAFGDGQYNHPLTVEQWKKLPEWLDNPAAMFERRDDGHLTLIAPEKIDGKAVVIGMVASAGTTKSPRQGDQPRHLVLTVYPKDRGVMPLGRRVESGDMVPLYVDQRKGPSFFDGSGVQFPGRIEKLRASNPRLKTGRDLVKYRAERGPMFSRKRDPETLSRQLVGRIEAEVLSRMGSTGEFIADQIHDGFRRDWIDEFIDLQRAEEQTAEKLGIKREDLPDHLQARRQENLRHGAYQDRLGRAERQFFEPVAKILGEANLDREDFADYLWWRHAGERDAYLREKHKTNPGPADLAGIDPKEARANIDALPEATRRAFEKAAEHIDALRQHTLDVLVDSGQIRPEVRDSLLARWQHYVPLRGLPKGEGDPILASYRGGGSGRGLSMLRNPLGKKALGRKSRPSDILEQMHIDLERALIGVEKQKVLKRIIGLIQANPEIGTVDPVKTEKREVNGVIEHVPTKGDVQQQLLYLHNGQPVRIEMSNPYLTQAVLNMNEPVHAIIRFWSYITRWMSSVWTAYSPYFMLINPVRDMEFAALGIGAEHGRKALRKAAKFYPQTFKALHRDAKGEPMDKDIDRYAREFGLMGGKTGYTIVNDIGAMRSKLNRLFRKERKGLSPAKVWSNLMDFTEAANGYAENSARLAVFAALRDSGVSAEKAAEYAKNITVNFNKKGRLSKHVNMAYMFFNAAVQGTVRVANLARNRTFRNTMVALVGASYATALMQMIAMGDDDDGESLYLKRVTDGARLRTIPFPFLDEEWIAIPIPYGPNFFNYLGNKMAEVTYEQMRGRPVDPGKVAGQILSAASQSFSPISVEDGVKAWQPSAIRVLNNFLSGTDDRGRPLNYTAHYEGESNAPKFLMGNASTGAGFKAFARFLNNWSGGSDYEAGWLNFTPEQLRYVTENGLGGMYRLGTESYELMEKMLTDDKIRPQDVPLSNVFLRSRSIDRQQQESYFDKREKTKDLKRQFAQAHERQDQAAMDKLLSEHPWLRGSQLPASHRLGKMAQAGTPVGALRRTESAIRDLRKQREAAYLRTGQYEGITLTESRAELRRIDGLIAEQQKRFTTAFNRAEGRGMVE